MGGPLRTGGVKFFAQRSVVKLAGLRPQLDADMAMDLDLAANWATACAWTEASRYEFHTKDEAETFLEAVTNPAHGVLPWIRTHW
jgi:hypothetical protein